jgi:heat shock protein HslJ
LPSATTVDAAELVGHAYVAIDVTEEGEPFASIAEARLELQFDGGAHFFAGAGCNGMGGDYQVVDGRLVLTNTVVPLRACVGPGMRYEAWYYTFLQSSPTIGRNNTGLLLISGETVVTYRNEPATTSPAPSKSTVSERELLATFDVLSVLPGFQVGGLTPDGDEVLVYWNGEFGPEAQAAVKDASRRGVVVNVIPVPYSSDELRKIAGALGKALAAKGIDLEGYRIGGTFDAIVVWGSDLDESADARRVAEETAADILPADLRFAIERSPPDGVFLRRTRT